MDSIYPLTNNVSKNELSFLDSLGLPSYLDPSKAFKPQKQKLHGGLSDIKDSMEQFNCELKQMQEMINL